MSMTTQKNTPQTTPAAAAEAEFDKRRKQFGGDTKIAQMFAREAYDKAADDSGCNRCGFPHGGACNPNA
jgi:hypothetical protein